jgi:hypothetical protein
MRRRVLTVTESGEIEMTENGPSVPEDPNRLVVIKHEFQKTDQILKALKGDQVVLVRNINPEQADSIMYDVAGRFGLSDALKLQAGFAGLMGHRHNIGKYFMSVNQRDDYQFIPPHSEGDSFTGMQLAAFYCYENSTDGGESILMNVNNSTDIWQSFRELKRRGRLASRQLAPGEISRARGLYQINLPTDILREDDQILEERPTAIPDLTVVRVLTKPIQAESRILDRKLYVYWDSIASIDFDSGQEYARMLRQCGLMKEPQGGLELGQLDNCAKLRIWHSGVKYAQLFKCKITCKLVPGDFVIQNNLTWTHATSNWTPGSGTRKIAASFA